MDQLFSRFDYLCAENLCYKVCTIGDCYVATGYHGDVKGFKRQAGNELLNLVRFSNQLIEAIKETNIQLQTRL